MTGPGKCLIYIAAIGIVGFTLGRALPKRWFNYDAAPFKELPFENGGHFYRRLGIHRWHKLLPDMSRILPGTMPENSMISPFLYCPFHASTASSSPSASAFGTWSQSLYMLIFILFLSFCSPL